MTHMDIFAPILCCLFLYSFSIIQIPIGLIGGFIQLLIACVESDPDRSHHKYQVAKILFISGIPFCGPAMAFNRYFAIGK